MLALEFRQEDAKARDREAFNANKGIHPTGIKRLKAESLSQ
jgi:hypothetical protein